MLLLAGAFIAGVLTTLAPCVLPLLPVIVGGLISQSGKKSVKSFFNCRISRYISDYLYLTSKSNDLLY